MNCVTNNAAAPNYHHLALLLLLCGLCAAPHLSAQPLIQTPAQADSLRRVIATAKHDTTRINAMNELSDYLWYRKSQYDSAMTYAQEAQKMAERVHFRKGAADALNNMGRVYRRRGKYSEALENSFASLRIHQEIGNKRGIAYSLINIGNVYHNQGKYTEALEYHFKSLRIQEEIGNKSGIASSLNNIALVYLDQGKYAEALEYYFQSLQIFEKLGNKANIAASLNNIADVYKDQGKYAEALENYFKSLRIAEEIGNKDGIANSLTSIALVYYNQGKYAEALEYHFKSLRIREEIGDKSGIAFSLGSIANVYDNQGKYTEALEYHFKSLRIAEEIGNKSGIASSLNDIGYIYNKTSQFKQALPYLFQSLQSSRNLGQKEGIAITLNNISISYRGQGRFDSALVFSSRSLTLADSLRVPLRVKEALEELSLIMDSLGRHKESLAYFKRYTIVKDSLVNLESLNKSSALKEGYEAEKREQQIALLNKEKALQETELARRGVIQWSLAGFLVLVAASALWLWRLNRQKLRAYKKVSKQQKVLEDQAAEIQQANMELHQQNEELTALNIEKNELMGIVSHDLKNPIGAVRSYAELIENQTFTGDEVLSAAAKIGQVSDRMLELVKNLLDVNHLESGGMQLNMVNFDITPVVEAAIYQYRVPAEAKQITLHFSNEASQSIVSADEQALMQVLDNLVSNAVKYSPHGKQAFVRILRNADAVRVEVQDEGEGISQDDMKKLFGKFARLTTQPTGGEHSTGLGLSIVKKMVEAMNGKVWCESEVGKGSTFIVELPSAV